MIQRIAIGVSAVLACVALSGTTARAQDIDELDEGVALETPFERGIEPGVWELGLQIGYIDLSAKLMEASGIIVDLENAQEAIFADMELDGDSGFAPLIRINRNLGTHLSFVNSIGFTIGDYTQKVTGSQEKWKSPVSTNTLTPTEIETGSYFMWRHEHGFAYYPRGRGMVQPFLTAGVGTNHFSINSKYIGGTAGNLAFSYGAGLRIVADDLFSITLEVRNYNTKIQYEVARNYKVIPNLASDGLIAFPTSQLVDVDDMTDAELVAIIDRLDLRQQLGILLTDTGQDIRNKIFADGSELPRRYPRVVSGYEEESYSSLWFSLGFTAAF